MASSLQGGVDAPALILGSEAEGIVERGEGVAVVLRHIVILIDDAVAVHVLVFDVTHLHLSELLHRAVVDISLILEESQCDESALSVGRAVDDREVGIGRCLNPFQYLALHLREGGAGIQVEAVVEGLGIAQPQLHAVACHAPLVVIRRLYAHHVGVELCGADQDVAALLIEGIECDVELVKQSQVGADVCLIGRFLCKVVGGKLSEEGAP